MSKQSNEKNKINYVKPKILDLGPVTPAIGGDCIGGAVYLSTVCQPGQTPKDDDCVSDGTSAEASCALGFGFPT